MREMKDSGVEWIGNIPKNWSILKLKYVLKFSGSGTTPSSNKLEFYDGDIEWIQSGDLYHTNTIVNTKVKLKSLALKYCPALKFYKAPFIVIAMYGASVGNASISCINACTNQACCVLYPNNENNLKFLYYWIVIAKNELLKKSIGGGQPNINQITIKNLNFINLPYKNQQAIADFLDAKCADIDSLTEDIQKQIDILKEYKKSVITQAVTKGIAPNVEMKDSGIAWIGKMPKRWIYPKITYILDIEHEYPIGDGDHGTIKANNYVQEGIPFIRVQNLGFAAPLRLDDVVYITKKQNITIKNSTLKPDDILFVKTGATIGKVGIVPKELLISNTTSHVGKITVNQKIIVPRFLFYALSSTVGYKLLWDIAGQKSTRPELSIEEIKRLHIILPDSLQEQQNIVDYLDAQCANIDAAIAGKQKQLDVLKEYKKSLIYEYVTGKKEVPCREYDPS